MNQNNLSINELFKLAFHYHSQNNLEQAKTLYKNILKSFPNHFESIYLLGTIYAQTQKYHNAEEFLKKAISINPNVSEAHNNLGNVSHSLGKFQEAIADRGVTFRSVRLLEEMKVFIWRMKLSLKTRLNNLRVLILLKIIIEEV